jgi:hypothetical protein
MDLDEMALQPKADEDNKGFGLGQEEGQDPTIGGTTTTFGIRDKT